MLIKDNRDVKSSELDYIFHSDIIEFIHVSKQETIILIKTGKLVFIHLKINL